MIATWRWDRDDQLPNGRQLATEWLSQLEQRSIAREWMSVANRGTQSRRSQLDGAGRRLRGHGRRAGDVEFCREAFIKPAVDVLTGLVRTMVSWPDGVEHPVYLVP